jgi:hypothetical protein
MNELGPYGTLLVATAFAQDAVRLPVQVEGE